MNQTGIAKLIHYQERPDLWVRECLHASPTPYQDEILLALARENSVAVHTGHGVGKTCCDAWALLWFMFCFYNPKVVSTAPTWRQVQDLLWSEVHRWIRQLDPEAAQWPGKFELNKTKLVLSSDVFATGESCTEPENIEGYHAPSILYIIDEAKQVPDPIFISVEGALTSGTVTGGVAKRLYTSTPGDCIGEFYQICMGRRPGWRVINVNGEDSPFVDPAWIEDKKYTWGEESFLYHTRVQGKFDDRGDDTIISISDAERCCLVPLEPTGLPELGVDVARRGRDRTVIVVRQGPCVLSMIDRQLRDTAWTVETVEETVRRIADRLRVPVSRIRIKVDDVGVGGGVTDQLRKDRFAVVPVIASSRPHNQRRYLRRRDELWYEFAERVKNSQVDFTRLSPRYRTELCGELAAPAGAIEARFVEGEPRDLYVAETKDKTSRRLGKSPDLADAVLLAFAAPPPARASGIFSLMGARMPTGGVRSG